MWFDRIRIPFEEMAIFTSAEEGQKLTITIDNAEDRSSKNSVLSSDKSILWISLVWPLFFAAHLLLIMYLGDWKYYAISETILSLMTIWLGFAAFIKGAQSSFSEELHRFIVKFFANGHDKNEGQEAIADMDCNKPAPFLNPGLMEDRKYLQTIHLFVSVILVVFALCKITHLVFLTAILIIAFQVYLVYKARTIFILTINPDDNYGKMITENAILEWEIKLNTNSAYGNNDVYVKLNNLIPESELGYDFKYMAIYSDSKIDANDSEVKNGIEVRHYKWLIFSRKVKVIYEQKHNIQVKIPNFLNNILIIGYTFHEMPSKDSGNTQRIALTLAMKEDVYEQLKSTVENKLVSLREAINKMKDPIILEYQNQWREYIKENIKQLYNNTIHRVVPGTPNGAIDEAINSCQEIINEMPEYAGRLTEIKLMAREKFTQGINNKLNIPDSNGDWRSKFECIINDCISNFKSNYAISFELQQQSVQFGNAFDPDAIISGLSGQIDTYVKKGKVCSILEDYIEPINASISELLDGIKGVIEADIAERVAVEVRNTKWGNAVNEDRIKRLEFETKLLKMRAYMQRDIQLKILSANIDALNERSKLKAKIIIAALRSGTLCDELFSFLANDANFDNFNVYGNPQQETPNATPSISFVVTDVSERVFLRCYDGSPLYLEKWNGRNVSIENSGATSQFVIEKIIPNVIPNEKEHKLTIPVSNRELVTVEYRDEERNDGFSSDAL